MKDYENQLRALIDPNDFSQETKSILETIKSDPDFPREDTIVPHSGNLDEREGHVFAGNLIVEGDLYVNAHTYIIGDLKVSGVLYGGIHCILMVAGNIECSGMCLTRTYGYVTGNIKVHQFAFFHTHGSMVLFGQLSTKLYINDDTWYNEDIRLEGCPSFSHTLDNIQATWTLEDGATEGEQSFEVSIRAILNEEAFQIKDGRINLFHAMDLLSSGKEIFR
ncbi:hypothetical protein [Paraflavitalea sp. CAU 1676]|uniref:hypothetical protein n=1 Tax=Paraflavitalea sp. CAU 1676 TaxID=3032598 RepID=UPI0023D9ADA5|nr:hypothetical protein [Paraflavitalea sp. CAU 1676]MDF2187986.1 hypothetical protein [Paraflavitalea sp. CAU 1676]